MGRRPVTRGPELEWFPFVRPLCYTAQFSTARESNLGGATESNDRALLFAIEQVQVHLGLLVRSRGLL